MKKSHYLRLLASDREALSFFLVAMAGPLALIYCMFIRREDSFTPAFTVFVWVAISFLGLMSGTMLTAPSTGGESGDTPGVPGNPGEGLEFLFTRAISRRSLFYARASRILPLCLLPFVEILAFGLCRPMVRVDLPDNPYDPNNVEIHAKAEQFYITHFASRYSWPALARQAQSGGYVVLPHGRLDLAVFTIAFACFMMLLCQFAYTFVWGRKWAGSLIYLTAIFLVGGTLVMVMLSTPPTIFDAALAWVAQHPVPTLVALGLLAFVTVTRTCRRYIDTEITS